MRVHFLGDDLEDQCLRSGLVFWQPSLLSYCWSGDPEEINMSSIEPTMVMGIGRTNYSGPTVLHLIFLTSVFFFFLTA